MTSQSSPTLWALDNEHAAVLFQAQLLHIVNRLRETREHSGPFLQRVTRKEAPDYHLFVKEPMDLGTMLRSVRSGAYTSLVDFEHDLRLIFSNCRLYNDAQSSFCAHAQALESLADSLFLAFPPIRILPSDVDDAERLTSQVARTEQQPVVME